VGIAQGCFTIVAIVWLVAVFYVVANGVGGVLVALIRARIDQK